MQYRQSFSNAVRQWLDSLVNRAVVLVVLAIAFTALVVMVVIATVSRQEMESQARARVATLADLIATDLDDSISERFDVLSHVASTQSLDGDVLEQDAQVLLDDQMALQRLFEDVIVFSESGEVLASHPGVPEAIRAQLTDPDFFRITTQQMTTVISEPFLSATGTEALVMISAPLFDRRGRLTGVIGGTFGPGSQNLMNQVEGVHLGESGYTGIATRSGLTLAHPGPDMILHPLPPKHPLLMQAMTGFEGVEAAQNRSGVEALMAIRQLNQAPWFVVVVWPEDEAFAPVMRLTRMTAWVTLGLILFLAPLALIGFRRLLRPLNELSVQVSRRHMGTRNAPITTGGGREIRKVAETFNLVLDERAEVLASLAEREAFFRSLSNSAPIGIIQTDVLGRIEFANPAFEQITGIVGERLKGRYLVAEVYEQDQQRVLHDWRQSLGSEEGYRGQLRVRDRASGNLVWLDAMAAPIETHEKTMGTITVVRDISHELEIEEMLKTEKTRAEAILGALQEGVLLTDHEGTMRYANGAGCVFLGVSGDYINESLFDLIHIEVAGEAWTPERLLGREMLDNLDVVLRNARGQSLDVELTMLRLRRGDAVERLVFVLRDDRERRRREERLSWEATHDTLTGLLNRRGFNEILRTSLSEAPAQNRASVLVLIDLDHFKPVNDQGGHLLGDQLLRRLAGCLTDAVRQSDYVARLGGDEFGIILPACGLERASELAEEIRLSVEGLRVEQEGTSYGVTASIGLTEIAATDSGPRETIARADEGCYAAKARGRNAVVSVPVPRAG